MRVAFLLIILVIIGVMGAVGNVGARAEAQSITRVICIPFDYQNKPHIPGMTVDAIKTAMYQMRDFYWNDSFGKNEITFEVTQYCTLPMDYSDEKNPNEVFAELSKMQKGEYKSKLEENKRFMWVGEFPYESALGGDWAGIAFDNIVTVEGKTYHIYNIIFRSDAGYPPFLARTLSPTRDLYQLFAHEFGHSFGYNNAIHKKMLGWLQPLRVEKTGTYDIYPRGSWQNNLKAISVPVILSDGPTDCYFEFLQPIGYDKLITAGNVNQDVFDGALVHALEEPIDPLPKTLLMTDNLTSPQKNVGWELKSKDGTKIKILSVSRDTLNPGNSKLSISVEFFEIKTSALPDAKVGKEFNCVLQSMGGYGVVKWAISSLPSWLSFDSITGKFFGVPVSAGVYNLYVTATDDNQNVRNASLTLQVVNPLKIETEVFPNAKIGVGYNQVLKAKYGNGYYEWSIISGQLPSGLKLNGCIIEGLPENKPGVYNFTAQVKSGEETATKDLIITLVKGGPEITTTPNKLPDAYVGSAYSKTLSAQEGKPPYTWSISNAPAGLFIYPDSGELHGPLQTAGLSNKFNVKVTDSNSPAGSSNKDFYLDVYNLPLITSQSVSGTVESKIDQYLKASGGKETLARKEEGNILSGLGLKLESYGKITGTPVKNGTFTFQAKVTDVNYKSDSKPISITIEPATLKINFYELPDGKAGEEYFPQTLTAKGGVQPYTWTKYSGELPPDLRLTSAGMVTGTPTKRGEYAFMVQVTDNQGIKSEPQNFGIKIAPKGLGVVIEEIKGLKEDAVRQKQLKEQLKEEMSKPNTKQINVPEQPQKQSY